MHSDLYALGSLRVNGITTITQFLTTPDVNRVDSLNYLLADLVLVLGLGMSWAEVPWLDVDEGPSSKNEKFQNFFHF